MKCGKLRMTTWLINEIPTQWVVHKFSYCQSSLFKLKCSEACAHIHYLSKSQVWRQSTGIENTFHNTKRAICFCNYTYQRWEPRRVRITERPCTATAIKLLFIHKYTSVLLINDGVFPIGWHNFQYIFCVCVWHPFSFKPLPISSAMRIEREYLQSSSSTSSFSSSFSSSS
jgi:hypothetical protein